jgi:cell division septum initiation protein DivIVA
MNAKSTLNEMVNTWITGNPNNTGKTGYNATNVAQYLQQLGVQATPNTPIGQIDSSKLAAAIAHFETGYSAGGAQGGNLIQTLAEQLLNGDAAPSQTKDRKEYGAAVALANQLSLQRTGKPFDVQAADINYQNAQNIRPILNNESSANAHLDTVMKDAKTLGLTGNRLANIAILESKLAVGDSSAKNYVQAVQDAQSEIAKVLAGNGAVTDDVRRQAEGFLDKYVGPDTLQGLIDQARTLMHQKVIAYTAKRNTSGELQMPAGYSGSGNANLSDLNFQF